MQGSDLSASDVPVNSDSCSSKAVTTKRCLKKSTDSRLQTSCDRQHAGFPRSGDSQNCLSSTQLRLTRFLPTVQRCAAFAGSSRALPPSFVLELRPYGLYTMVLILSSACRGQCILFGTVSSKSRHATCTHQVHVQSPCNCHSGMMCVMSAWHASYVNSPLCSTPPTYELVCPVELSVKEHNSKLAVCMELQHVCDCLVQNGPDT